MQKIKHNKKTPRVFFPYYVEKIEEYRQGKITEKELIEIFKEKFGEDAEKNIETHTQAADYFEAIT